MRIERPLLAVALCALTVTLAAEEHDPATDHRTHQDSAAGHDGAQTPPLENPAVPEGMSLAETLQRADNTPPQDYPDPLMDDAMYAWMLADLMEYRIPDDRSPEHVGWELQGWVGRDIDKFWWKHEGEWIPDDDAGETETDLLYSRLITPFWNAQGGLRYAQAWSDANDDHLFSLVLALLGMAPYQVEIDSSLVLTEDGDVSMEFEGEYDLRLSQRLVLQPRLESAVYAQDVPERNIWAGINDVTVDLRLRYAIRRRFAPYLGLRSQHLLGEARNRADDDEETMLLLGLRWAW